MINPTVSQPAGVAIFGWLAVVYGVFMAMISLVWIGFSRPISEAGAEIATGADGLGALAFPLKYALASGLVSLGLGIWVVVAGRSFLEGRQWSLTAFRTIMVLGIVASIAWGTFMLLWLLNLSTIDSDAPPPVAAALLVGFPTLMAVVLFGLLFLFLHTKSIRMWFRGSQT